MKWPIIGLFALGFAAAVCAAILVASLQTSKQQGPTRVAGEAQAPAEETQVSILVASKDLDRMSVVAGDDVGSKNIARDAFEEGTLTDAVQVVGKVLRTPVKAGQPYNRSHFASEGSAVNLASALEPGKRAVCIALSDSMAIEPLLYPGSTVDVLASMSADSRDGLGSQRVSITLLQRVVVLAVGHETVVASTKQNDDQAILARGPRPTVTLLVTPEQAEILKLAMDEGSLSLTLRNPMDDRPVDPSGTDLTKVAPVFANLAERVHQAELQKERDELAARARDLEKTQYEMERTRFGIERDRQEMEITRAKLEAERFAEMQKKDETLHPQWETLVIRGGVVESKTFDLPTSDGK